MTIARTRGDDYAVPAIISLNGSPIDISGDVVKFSYKSEDVAVKTITGTPTATTGEIEFFPEIGVDFMVAGVFTFDIQRVSGGKTYTHQKGILILDGDVTP